MPPSWNYVVRYTHASSCQWVARVFDHGSHCGGMLTKYFTDHPMFTSNECDYEKLMYKGSGLMILCRRELVYSMPAACPHISLIAYAGYFTSVC